MRTISLKIPSNLDQQLTQFSKQHGTTRSAVLRDAVREYIEKPRNSFAAQAMDLAGSVAGPKDLSTSSKHMSGYGR